jgi:ABC-2 type transport system permease protein
MGMVFEWIAWRFLEKTGYNFFGLSAIKITHLRKKSNPSPTNKVRKANPMNPALWRKAVGDAWLQLLVSSSILIAFAWIFLWLMSQIDFGVFATLLKAMPPFFQRLTSIPLADLATPAGRTSILFVHVVTLLVCVGWSVGRGSDPISGEIGRGTMDLLASLPIYRSSLLVPPGIIATLGAAFLALSVWLGIGFGLATIKIADVGWLKFFPGVLNLFSMMFCLSGATTFISTWTRDRWRTVFIAIGFFLVSFILEMVARSWENGGWLGYFTFMSQFHPQEFILIPERAGWPMFRSNGILLGLGLAGYVAAALIFWCRDVPISR